ncbi:MAG: rod shape-determining protein MreC [Candidatus Binatia bacterium]
MAAFVLEAMQPLQAGVAAVRDAIRTTWHAYIALVGVKQENARLRQRILDLEQRAIRAAEIEQTDQRLAKLLSFRSTLERHAIAAQIIGRDPLPWFGTITINRGRADRVHQNMAVLSPFGVVGQIMATSEHAARVLLVTDHNSGVDAVVQRSRARGIVEGALDGSCVMKYLKRGADVQVGDRVVTSGLDGIYPKGILVGNVMHLTRGNRALLQRAEVKPGVPLDRIEEVLVVRAQRPNGGP